MNQFLLDIENMQIQAGLPNPFDPATHDWPTHTPQRGHRYIPQHKDTSIFSLILQAGGVVLGQS